MKKISTQIQIDATAEKVWLVLMTFENYPDWNPFVRKIEGQEIRSGDTIVFASVGAGMHINAAVYRMP